MSKTSAKIVADTVHPEVPSARITTIEVYAPRFLLAEINTHGVLAKSAASSRAIPVKKRIKMVEDHGFIPESFGKNKPGMQASEVLDSEADADAREAWQFAMNIAIECAGDLADIGAHKQHANRLLEPFAYYHGVITATEWTNFFALRMHPDAQPEFQDLALKMHAAMTASTPIRSKWHLPYMDDLDWSPFSERELFDISGARCARVSYQTHDGKPFNLERDQARVLELVKGGHMSPFEHAARADTIITRDDVIARTGLKIYPPGTKRSWWEHPGDHRKFWGWIPDRVEIERVLGMPPARRDSYAPFSMA